MVMNYLTNDINSVLQLRVRNRNSPISLLLLLSSLNFVLGDVYEASACRNTDPSTDQTCTNGIWYYQAL